MSAVLANQEIKEGLVQLELLKFLEKTAVQSLKQAVYLNDAAKYKSEADSYRHAIHTLCNRLNVLIEQVRVV